MTNKTANESTDIQDKIYLSHIDGIKGISCLLIFLGHFSGIFKYSTNGILLPNWVNFALKYPLNIFFDENFWLMVFCVISGYLYSPVKVLKFRDLIEKSLKRFLRFFFPILGSYIFVYIVSITLGYHNSETAALFTNKWYQNFYSIKISLLDVITEPFKTIFLSSSVYNSPFWMIGQLFTSSILFFLFRYLKGKLPKCGILYDMMIIIIIYLVNGYIGLAFAIGTILPKLKYINNRWISIVLFLLAFILADGLHIYIYNKIFIPNILSKYFIYFGTWKIIYISVMILTVKNINIIMNILTSKVLKFMHEISFGIYAVHWPIICSFSALIFLKLFDVINFNLLIMINCIITFLTIITIAVLFHFSIDKVGVVLTKRILKVLSLSRTNT